MSHGTVCACSPEFRVVHQRNSNRSAFSGYRETPSRFSEVGCTNCGARWRTAAKYVTCLPDAPELVASRTTEAREP